MSYTTIFLIAGVVLLAIFFLIAKLAIRWAIRLVIIGLIIVALLGSGVFLWWSSRLSSKPQPNRPRPAPSRRTSAH
ncbi:MAG: hypothetical protein ABR556_04365 [Pyrinomonadaceae bacterium]